MKFVEGGRALVVGGTLVITDLHVGLEKKLEDEGFLFPSSTKKLYEKIVKIMDQNSCEKLLLLGDVKERVPGTSYQERAEIPWLLNKLEKDYELVIVKGNHDAGLEKITRAKVVKEHRVGSTGFFHGHAWPSKELVQNSDVLVMGHVHPVVVFRDSLGVMHQEQCWVVAKLDDEKMKNKYGSTVNKLVIMPSFNPLLSGVHEASKAITRFIKSEEKFLLDLTQVK